MSEALPTRDLLRAVSHASAELAAAAAASVVLVHGRPRRPSSGLVVAPDRVVTTSHSVEREEGVRVRTSDGRLLDAEVAGHAPGPDIVLLRVAGLDAPRLMPALAPEGALPRPGELVLVVGRAWSGHPHVRLVAVSGIGGPLRADDGSTIETVLGLPVAPYPGVSGSAVIGSRGELTAIATAGIVRGRVLGLPVSALRAVVETLEARGTVARGFLGITTQPARLRGRQSDAAGQSDGLVVVGVAGDSPASSSLLVGDVIVGAAGAAVASPDDLLAALGPETVGAPLALRVVRGLAAVDVQVTVGPRPPRW